MYLPLFLSTRNVEFLVIGAGQIALAKAETLLDFGAKVTIISADNKSVTAQLLQKMPLKFIADNYHKNYLANYDVIIAATDDKVLNRLIVADANNLGKMANAVDDLEVSNFIFGAYVKQGNITISSSTSGASPVLARYLKEKITNILPQNLDLLGEFSQKNRELIKDKFSDLQARRLFWQEVIEGAIGVEICSGNITKAQQLLEEKLHNISNKKTAAVYFIGAGCGDPELITLKAIKLLSQADVVIYDRLVAKEILAYARKDALKISVGKTKDCHTYSQETINKMICDYALQGNIVARLKGGDPAIFAHLGEEVEAVSQLNIPYQIVPGISAASGAAASIGIPLTSRSYNKSTKLLAVYKENLVDDEYWRQLAQSEDSLVFYMSSHNLTTVTQKLLQFGYDGETPLVVIEQATTIFQKNYFTKVSEFSRDFADKKFVSPSIAIIGKVVSDKYQRNQNALEGEFFQSISK